MRKNKNDIFIGFVVGAIANVLGILLWWIIFSRTNIETFLQIAYEENKLGMIISLGALLSFGSFFLFIKRSLETRARGVLLWVFVATFITMYLEFFT